MAERGDPEADISVLLVCMGNICRSPMAEGWLSEQLRRRAIDTRVFVDSAGTHGYHAGSAPDPRAQAATARRGFHIGHLQARQVVTTDFERFDLLLPMDSDNFDFLVGLAPDEGRQKIRYFLDFAPSAGLKDVPDPYYGGDTGFERVLDLVEDAVKGLLVELDRLAQQKRR